FLAVLAGSVSRVTRGLLFGQKLNHLLGFFALLGFGSGLGLFSFAALALFLFAGGALGGLGGQPLFLGALGHALIARRGDGQALLGALVRRGLGGFGAGFDLGQHFGAGLGGRFQAVGEFFVV